MNYKNREIAIEKKNRKYYATVEGIYNPTHGFRSQDTAINYAKAAIEDWLHKNFYPQIPVKKGGKLVQGYKGYQVHSYEYRGQYGHHRIRKIVRPDGSTMIENQKQWYGTSHNDCLHWAMIEIDKELQTGAKK